jgi:hypothetical protein
MFLSIRAVFLTLADFRRKGTEMDPTIALMNLRGIVSDLHDPARIEEEGLDRLAYDFAEVFESLDEWLSKDGFLPEQWQWKGAR